MDNLGKEKQFLELYERYIDPMFKHCWFRISDHDKAKDTTQTVFEKTWEFLVRGGDIANPKAFLYRIANNLIIDTYRKKKEDSLDTLMESGFDVASDDHENVFKNLAHQEIVKLLDTLPLSYRDVLVMRYIDDLTLSEIAGIANETENLIAVRIYRGIKKLRDILNNPHESKR